MSSTDTDGPFYVYVLFRPDGSPCYIGKGKGNRWLNHERRCFNKRLAEIIQQSSAPLPKIKIREGLKEVEAFETETAFISAIGRVKHGGPLVNATDGGDGTSGHVRPATARAATALAMRGNKLRLGKSSHNRGKKLSAATCEKIRLARLGTKQSDELKAKKRDASKRVWESADYRAQRKEKMATVFASEEYRLKQREISRKRWASEEFKEKMRARFKGRVHSAETRAKIGAAQRGISVPTRGGRGPRCKQEKATTPS